MARYDCEVCSGSGLVRLPLHKRVSARRFEATEVTIEVLHRDYPCPECGDVIPLERLATVQFHSMVDSRIDDPEFTRRAIQSAAHNLIGQMIAKNFISSRRGPDEVGGLRYPLIVTLGVVSPIDVATLERRIGQHQDVVAQEVVDEAAASISNWGSYYGHSEIQKSRAIECLREAVKTVVTRRAQQQAAA